MGILFFRDGVERFQSCRRNVFAEETFPEDCFFFSGRFGRPSEIAENQRGFPDATPETLKQPDSKIFHVPKSSGQRNLSAPSTCRCHV